MCDPTFRRFSRTPTCDRRTDTHRQTDRHRAIAYIADRSHPLHRHTHFRYPHTASAPTSSNWWWRNDPFSSPICLFSEPLHPASCVKALKQQMSVLGFCHDSGKTVAKTGKTRKNWQNQRHHKLMTLFTTGILQAVFDPYYNCGTDSEHK